jgi:hypothetical protein
VREVVNKGSVQMPRSSRSSEEIVADFFERIIIMTRHHDKNIAVRVA